MTKKATKTSLSGGGGPAGPAAKQKKASAAAKQKSARPASARPAAGRKQANAPTKPKPIQRKQAAAAKPQGTLPRAKQTKTSAARETKRANPEWELRLYVAGQSQKSISALANLKRICEEHLPGKYRIEVIDLMKQPQLAAGDQILAIPTLVRKLPSPICKIVGDLSSTERALVGLDIRRAASTSKGFENRD